MSALTRPHRSSERSSHDRHAAPRRPRRLHARASRVHDGTHRPADHRQTNGSRPLTGPDRCRPPVGRPTASRSRTALADRGTLESTSQYDAHLRPAAVVVGTAGSESRSLIAPVYRSPRSTCKAIEPVLRGRRPPPRFRGARARRIRRQRLGHEPNRISQSAGKPSPRTRRIAGIEVSGVSSHTRRGARFRPSPYVGATEHVR